MKTLNEYGEDYMQFLDTLDAVWFFTKGACHAFAIELDAHFRANGEAPKLVYVASEHQSVARHVLVKMGGVYWDVVGKHSLEQIAAQWSKSDTSRIRPVGHVGWISVGNHTPNTSYLGLMVDPAFLASARARARQFIAADPGKFHLKS